MKQNFSLTMICICLLMGSIMIASNVMAQSDDYPDIKGISQFDQLPQYLHDRGPGTPTSMFGTFARKGELLIYPFFEYYLDDNMEYAPDELGYGLDEDFEGVFRGSEYLMFLGFGITDRLVFEIEVAYMDASLEKSADDTTELPDKLEEIGWGDAQTQVNYMWKKETSTGPGFFSYLEVVYPYNKEKVLIGTGDWEYKLGTGLIRGFGWGTMTFRAAVEYSRDEEKAEIGEIAAEYLKRLSAHWRFYAGVEGTQDEVELITELQWHINDNIFFKFNNSFGITPKATDWAPETGIMISLRP